MTAVGCGDDLMLDIDSVLQRDIVVTWSGGPDSTGLIFLLLEKYSSRVFPIFINRGQKNYAYEKEAVYYYTKYFAKYKQFQQLTEVTMISPPSEFRLFTDKAKYALRNSDVINQGVRLALQKNVHTVLLATFQDENLYGDGSEKYLKAKTIEVISGTNDENFIVCSPFHFPLKFPKDKAVLFKVCLDMKFDLSKTRSCYENSSTHCGICHSCKSRHAAFLQTQTDNTVYLKKPAS